MSPQQPSSKCLSLSSEPGIKSPCLDTRSQPHQNARPVNNGDYNHVAYLLAHLSTPASTPADIPTPPRSDPSSPLASPAKPSTFDAPIPEFLLESCSGPLPLSFPRPESTPPEFSSLIHSEHIPIPPPRPATTMPEFSSRRIISPQFRPEFLPGSPLKETKECSSEDEGYSSEHQGDIPSNRPSSIPQPAPQPVLRSSLHHPPGLSASARILVGNLHRGIDFDTHAESLRCLFAQFGIQRPLVKMKWTSDSGPIAFIQFTKDEYADQAIALSHQLTLYCRFLRIELCNEGKKQRASKDRPATPSNDDKNSDDHRNNKGPKTNSSYRNIYRNFYNHSNHYNHN